jgi:hypothetical protein
MLSFVVRTVGIVDKTCRKFLQVLSIPTTVGIVSVFYRTFCIGILPYFYSINPKSGANICKWGNIADFAIGPNIADFAICPRRFCNSPIADFAIRPPTNIADSGSAQSVPKKAFRVVLLSTVPWDARGT